MQDRTDQLDLEADIQARHVAAFENGDQASAAALGRQLRSLAILRHIDEAIEDAIRLRERITTTPKWHGVERPRAAFEVVGTLIVDTTDD